MTDDKPIGEIIEAATTAFVAQCLEVPRQIVPKLYDPPPFGAFVKIGKPRQAAPEAQETDKEMDEEDDPFALPGVPKSSVLPLSDPAIYALVFAASTSSLEPSRRPSALGFADEDELSREQPQIFELLRTEFSGLLVAYSAGDGKGLRRHLPPRPPRIHSRVYPCDVDEIRALTDDLSFLRSILLPAGGAMPGVPADELVGACLRQARDVQTDDRAFLLRAGKALAALLAEDYDRLQFILRSVI